MKFPYVKQFHPTTLGFLPKVEIIERSTFATSRFGKEMVIPVCIMAQEMMMVAII